MSVRAKIVLIVALGVAACVGVSLMNEVFVRRSDRAAAVQRHINEALFYAQRMRLAESDFLSKGAGGAWSEMLVAFEKTDERLQAAAASSPAWAAPVETLRRNLASYKADVESAREAVQGVFLGLKNYRTKAGEIVSLLNEQVVDVYRELKREPSQAAKTEILDAAVAIVGGLNRSRLITEELFLFDDLAERQREKKEWSAQFDAQKKRLETAALQLHNEKNSLLLQSNLPPLFNEFFKYEVKLLDLYQQKKSLSDKLRQTGAKILDDCQALSEGVHIQYEREKSLNHELNWSLLGAVALLLSALGFWLASSITSQLKTLIAYAAKVANGELDAVVSGRFSRELGELAAYVSGMVTQLNHKIRALAKADDLQRETRRAQEATIAAEAATLRALHVEAFQRSEVAKLAGVLTRVAKGDLTARYEAGETDSDATDARAGFLELERALNATTRTLGKIIQKIQRVSDELFASAQEFVGFSSTMLASSESMSFQAGNVAGATEEMSMNINTMASAAEEISVNVSTVSATAELMSQSMNSVADAAYGMRFSISSIAESASSGARVAEQAKGMAHSATSAMSELGDAAQAIGKVTGVIKRIAEQTNLLALNATIEAASAGDAGRGFAVVAHEIKELATQSAKAAEDIASKIEGVQADTSRAISVIAEVARVIARIDEAVTSITAAVEKQTQSADAISENVSETTRGAADIAQAIAELARGANDTSQNAGQVAKGANDVAANILGVSKSLEQSKVGATRAAELAERLSGAAGELRDMVGAFVVGGAGAKTDKK